MNTLKLKKAWEVALAPAKQIPMQAIMMYMSGNSLQIFSIFMVYNLYVLFRVAGLGTNGPQVQESDSRPGTDQQYICKIRRRR